MSVATEWCDANPSISAADVPLPEPYAKLLIPTPSNLCSMALRPLMITGLIRDWMTKHFAGPLSAEEPDLRNLIWQEGVRTGMLIESIYRWRGDIVNKRPALIIKQNARQNVRYGIDDAMGINGHGTPRFATHWVGSHTVFCIQGSGASAEILATEVQRELTEYAHPLRASLGLALWQVTEVGEIAEVEEARESFVIPVTVGWAYAEGWALHQNSLKLRKVTIGALYNEILRQDIGRQ